MILVERYVAEQRRAAIGAFDQVMAQDRILRKLAAAVFKRFDVVDSLADERPLQEDVLVDVGDDTCVGIDACIECLELHVSRPLRARQADPDPRLQNPVAFDDPTVLTVKDGPVESMGQRSDHQAGRIPQQLCICIERDDVPNPHKDVCSADDLRKPVLPAPQQRVEVGELAALSLMPHPDSLLGIPASRPVQEVEDIGPHVGVPRVELHDAGAHQLDELGVAGERALRGVDEVRQERKVEMRISIGEVAHLQPGQRLLDPGRTGEHCWYGHQRAVVGRDPVFEIHPWQRLRRDQPRRQPVNDPDAEARCTHQRRHKEQREAHHPDRLPLQSPAEKDQGGECDKPDEREVAGQRKTTPHLVAEDAPREAHLGHSLERWTTAIDEIEADVRPACVDRLSGPILGQLNCLSRHLVFRQSTPSRNALNGVAVPIACRKVHRGIHPGRIAAERLFDQTVSADKQPPIVGDHESQAADAVANRYLIGCLSLSLGPHQLLGRDSLIGETVLEPAVCQRVIGVQPLELSHEFRDERARKNLTCSRHVSEHQDQIRRLAFDDFHHPPGPGGREIPLPPRGGNSRRDTPQILDQRQPQHEWQCPKLTQLQGLDRLIRGDKAVQSRGIHATVNVRDELEGNVVDARKAGQPTRRQSWKFLAVCGGQQSADRANLLFDQIEVVQEPLCGRFNTAIIIGGRCHEIVGRDEDAFVIVEAWQQSVVASPRGQGMRHRNHFGVPFQLLDAVEFRP